jgi:hypothetical protein
MPASALVCAATDDALGEGLGLRLGVCVAVKLAVGEVVSEVDMVPLGLSLPVGEGLSLGSGLQLLEDGPGSVPGGHCAHHEAPSPGA